MQVPPPLILTPGLKVHSPSGVSPLTSPVSPDVWGGEDSCPLHLEVGTFCSCHDSTLCGSGSPRAHQGVTNLHLRHTCRPTPSLDTRTVKVSLGDSVSGPRHFFFFLIVIRYIEHKLYSYRHFQVCSSVASCTFHIIVQSSPPPVSITSFPPVKLKLGIMTIK